jgi:hypothetical protein
VGRGDGPCATHPTAGHVDLRRRLVPDAELRALLRGLRRASRSSRRLRQRRASRSSTGCRPARAPTGFNNLLADRRGPGAAAGSGVDFAAHAAVAWLPSSRPSRTARVESLRSAYPAAAARVAEQRPAVVVCRCRAVRWTESGALVGSTARPASLSGSRGVRRREGAPVRWVDAVERMGLFVSNRPPTKWEGVGRRTVGPPVRERLPGSTATRRMRGIELRPPVLQSRRPILRDALRTEIPVTGVSSDACDLHFTACTWCPSDCADNRPARRRTANLRGGALEWGRGARSAAAGADSRSRIPPYPRMRVLRPSCPYVRRRDQGALRAEPRSK